MLVATLALASLAVVSAAPATSVEDRGLISAIVDGATGTLVCPKGYTKGSVTNKQTFPVSMKKISPVIDSFFDATWEGFTLTASTGKDNFPGATRTFSFGGVLSLTEQLVSNVNLSPVLIDRVWKGVGGATPNSLPVVASAFNANLSSWTEHFTLTPACLGKATDFSWTASYCSTNDPVAESLYSAAHTGPFEGLEAQFGTYTSCKAI